MRHLASALLVITFNNTPLYCVFLPSREVEISAVVKHIFIARKNPWMGDCYQGLLAPGVDAPIEALVYPKPASADQETNVSMPPGCKC